MRRSWCSITTRAWSTGSITRLSTNRPAASTGLLLFDLLGALEAPLDTVTAQAIYATIVADTGSFRFSNTSEEVLRVAADLIAAGANPQLVHRAVLGSYTRGRFQLLARGLEAAELEASDRVAWSYISRKMLEETSASEDEVSGLIEYLRLLEGVKVAILMVEAETRRFE